MVAAPSDDPHGPQWRSNRLSPTEERELGVGERGWHGAVGSGRPGTSRARWAVSGRHCPGPPRLGTHPFSGPLFRIPQCPLSECPLCAGCGHSAQGSTEGARVSCSGGGGQLHSHLTETSGKIRSLEPYEACFGALLSPPAFGATKGHSWPCTQENRGHSHAGGRAPGAPRGSPVCSEGTDPSRVLGTRAFGVDL